MAGIRTIYKDDKGHGSINHDEHQRETATIL